MREGTRLTFEELRDAAAAAVERSGRSQAEVARDLGVHRSAICRALKESGPRLSKLQRRILRALTPYRIERQLYFQVRRGD